LALLAPPLTEDWDLVAAAPSVDCDLLAAASPPLAPFDDGFKFEVWEEALLP